MSSRTFVQIHALFSGEPRTEPDGPQTHSSAIGSHEPGHVAWGPTQGSVALLEAAGDPQGRETAALRRLLGDEVKTTSQRSL